MTKITYEIVEHDGGWAYRVDGVFSETFPSHDLPAERRSAPRRNKSSRETRPASVQDKDGHWHEEVSAGNDRPKTDVKG